MLEATQFRDAEKYSNYLKTRSGRLRSDLAWENLQGFLPDLSRQRRVLDLGGGTGAMSVRLARKEFRVVLLDSSEEMLAIARKEAHEGGVASRISFRQEDAGRLQDLFEPESFDLVVCHNILEYVADPAAIVRSISYVLRKDGIFSVLVRNRAGEVLKAAIKSPDLGLANEALSAQTVVDSLYGKPARLFDLSDVVQMLTQADLGTTGIAQNLTAKHTGNFSNWNALWAGLSLPLLPATSRRSPGVSASHKSRKD